MSTPKNIYYGEELRKIILSAVQKIADVVEVTYGPNGTNVILDRGFKQPTITKDGVSVAKEIFFKDRAENHIAQIVKQSSLRANKLAGDGTTTAMVLTRKLIEALFIVVENHPDLNPIGIKRQLDSYKDRIIDELRKGARPCHVDTNLHEVISVSTNSDEELTSLIMEAFLKVGFDGNILVKETLKRPYVETSHGITIDNGYENPSVVNNHLLQAYESKNTIVFVTDDEIHERNYPAYFKAFITQLEENKAKEAVIFAYDFADEVVRYSEKLAQKGIRLALVKGPRYGNTRKHFLRDMQTMLDVTMIGDEEKGVLFGYGFVKSVYVRRNLTLIEGNLPGEKYKELVKRLHELYREKLIEDLEEANRLLSRYNFLTQKTATIYLSADSEAELHEKHDRVTDAICAARVAGREGVTEGAGVGLTKAVMRAVYPDLNVISNENLREDAVKSTIFISCAYPYFKLNEINYDKVDIKDWLDKVQLDKLVAPEGIYDPVFVTITALESAFSVAGILLTTSAIVVSEEESTYTNNI